MVMSLTWMSTWRLLIGQHRFCELKFVLKFLAVSILQTGFSTISHAGGKNRWETEPPPKAKKKKKMEEKDGHFTKSKSAAFKTPFLLTNFLQRKRH